MILGARRSSFAPGSFLAALAGLWLAGCASPPCEPDRGLGSCCREEADCDAPWTCLGDLPGGVCSRDCGEDHTCPAEATCVRVVSQSLGDLGSVCLLRCGGDLPACRADWSCRGTSQAGVSVCFPG